MVPFVPFVPNRAERRQAMYSRRKKRRGIHINEKCATHVYVGRSKVRIIVCGFHRRYPLAAIQMHPHGTVVEPSYMR